MKLHKPTWLGSLALASVFQATLASGAVNVQREGGSGSNKYDVITDVTIPSGKTLDLDGTVTGTALTTSGGTPGKIVTTSASGVLDPALIPTDDLTLQLRRGTDEDRQAATPADGEPMWTTDNKRLWIGDGITLGGLPAMPLHYGFTGTTDTDRILHIGDSTGFAETLIIGVVVESPQGSLKLGDEVTSDTVLNSIANMELYSAGDVSIHAFSNLSITADDGAHQVLTATGGNTFMGGSLIEISGSVTIGGAEGAVHLTTLGGNNVFMQAEAGSAGHVQVGEDSSTTEQMGLWFGNDTAIYRSGTNALRTDDSWTVGGKIFATTTATLPGINLGAIAGNPSTLAVADLWFNSTTNRFMGRDALATSVELVTTTNGQTLTAKTLVAPVLASTTSATVGAMWYGSGDDRLRYQGNSGTRDLVDLTLSQSLSNKTLTSPAIASPVVTGTTSSSGMFQSTVSINSATGIAAFSAVSTGPGIELLETDAAADSKRWDMLADSGNLVFRAKTDAGATGTWLNISRIGVLPGTATFYAKIQGTPTGTTPGFNPGGYAGNPSTPGNGDFWYNSSTGEQMVRRAGATEALLTTGNAVTVSNKTYAAPSITGTTTSTGMFTSSVAQVSPSGIAGFQAMSAAPGFELWESDAGTDLKRWGIYADAGALIHALKSDAGSVLTPWLTVSRSTTTPGIATFAAKIQATPTATLEGINLGGSVTTDPSSPADGGIWINNSSSRLKIKTAAGVREMADLTLTQTMTNKTLASPVVTGTLRLPAYTVGTLPAGTVGMEAYVTDATAPTYLGTLTGGGAVVCPVFYNGTAWVSH